MFDHVLLESLILFFFYLRSISHKSNCVPRAFVSCKQNRDSDENQVGQIAVKTVEQAKRSAEGSPDNAPSRKRSAFGDITNVSFKFFTEKELSSFRFLCSYFCFIFFILGNFRSAGRQGSEEEASEKRCDSKRITAAKQAKGRREGKSKTAPKQRERIFC